jgi:hypothetical protein
MGVTKEPRRMKINELKGNIPLAQSDLKGVVKIIRRINKQRLKFNKRGFTELSERLSEPTKKFQEKSAALRAVLEGLTEELKLTRMNKRSSKFFEWKPSPMNRRARKEVAKMLHERNKRVRK